MDGAAQYDGALSRLSVLFVDDDPLVRMQAQAFLEGQVQALHLAEGGQEGMFSYALHRPDVVVLDVNMPVMNGLELARAVRGITPEVPLVLLTSLDDVDTFRQAIALGVSDFLAKPVERARLLESLGRVAGTLHLRRELSRQIRLNELMLDASPSPSVLVDLETGRAQACNQLAQDLGFTVGEEVVSRHIPTVLEELRRGGASLISARNSREVESFGRHWMLHWAPVGSGGILFTAVDITRRVVFERFRDDVERIARHDLKTPLSAFTAVPDILLGDDNLTEDQREFILLIRDAGTRMLSMINLSLDLFKMETGTYTLPLARFDLAELAVQAVRQARAAARSLGVGVEFAAPAELPPLPVRGDELLCLSLLGNLLKNAAEASPRGTTVRLALETAPVTLLRVENQGEVPADMRTRFFEKYATSGKRGGTGLGTYSARMVARAHGGEVTLDCSRPGETTVRVQLPLAE